MAVAGSATISIAGAMANGIGSVIGTAATTGGIAAADAARNTDQRDVVDRLTRGLAASGDPASMTDDQRTNAVTVLIQQRVRTGAWSAEDRARAVDLVQRGANVSLEEANRRVTGMEQNLARAEQQAREAADAAARAASRAALWAFGALLIGAIVAAAGASAGVRNAVWLMTLRRPPTR
jgi:hypothetical protein